jgi:hypothetical protein
MENPACDSSKNSPKKKMKKMRVKTALKGS